MTTAQSMGQEESMACMYCDETDIVPGVPEQLCVKHLQLRAIAWVLEKQGKEVTAKSVNAFVDLLSDPVDFTPGEVAQLLRQMQKSNKEATHAEG